MSIILKALKKAEESKGKAEKGQIKVFLSIGRKTWGIFIAAACTLALVFFFAAYIFKIPLKTSQKITRPKTVLLSPTAPQTPVTEAGPDVSLFMEKALKFINEGKYKEAEKTLREALNATKIDPYIYNTLGLALKKQARYEDAVSAYRTALRIKPDFPEVMNNLAVSLEASGKSSEAEELYKKALSLNPAYAEAHLNYALSLEKKGKPSEAKTHYESFLSLSGDETLKVRVERRLKRLKPSKPR